VLENKSLTIPAFKQQKEVVLDLSAVHEAEKRIIEARTVNVASYNELEYCFNEGYRCAKKNMAHIGYEITKAEKAKREAKSLALLDFYPDFLREKKHKDSACIRDAYLETFKDYTDAQDRIDLLNAMLNLMEGKVKVFENICRYIKTEIQICIRSGVDSNKYLR
jgi:hypothetical protein